MSLTRSREATKKLRLRRSRSVVPTVRPAAELPFFKTPAASSNLFVAWPKAKFILSACKAVEGRLRVKLNPRNGTPI